MSLEEKKVAEVMSRTLYTVPVSASLEEIINVFLENRISAVIIVAENGEFLGILSKTDIIAGLRKYGKDLLERGVEDLLCPKPYTIDGNSSIKEAAQKMMVHKVHRLLVVSPSAVGKYLPVGIITATDILRAIAFTS